MAKVRNDSLATETWSQVPARKRDVYFYPKRMALEALVKGVEWRLFSQTPSMRRRSSWCLARRPTLRDKVYGHRFR
jgi:hypothetical protein